MEQIGQFISRAPITSLAGGVTNLHEPSLMIGGQSGQCILPQMDIFIVKTNVLMCVISFLVANIFCEICAILLNFGVETCKMYTIHYFLT